MLNSLISSMVWGISKALDALLNWILQLATLNLSYFSENFPVIIPMFKVLQGVGVGLIIFIGAFQTIKFLFGPLSDATTNPLEIIIRVIIAGFLVFVGNYFLEMIVNLFSYPYKLLLDVNSTTSLADNVISNIVETISGANASSGVGALAGLLVSLIIILALGWNSVKLGVEVVERFMMLGVLTYTSPLAWATISSKSTHSIFTKWISMFLGQCLLMILNVWSIKILINILSTATGSNVLFNCITALAFCKVAQRFDTYLQTLGINAATTGGAMVDDIMAVGNSLKLAGRSLGGSALLANDYGLGKSVQGGGILGGLGYMAGKRYSQSHASDYSEMQSILKDGPKTAKEAAQYADYQKAKAEGRDWNPVEFDAKYASAKERFIANDHKQAQQDGRPWTYAEAEQRWNEEQNAEKQRRDAEQNAERTTHQQRQRDIDTAFDTSPEAYRKYIQNQETENSSEYKNWKIERESMINEGFNLRNLRNLDKQEIPRIFNDDGTAIAPAMHENADGSSISVLQGKDNSDIVDKIALTSTPDAMVTGAGMDAASVVKANTVASHGSEVAQGLMNSTVNGGIQDSRVTAAAYEAMFSGENTTIDGVRGGNNSIAADIAPSKSIDSVMPGLSDAVSASIGEPIDGSGDVSNMVMGNGEFTGVYKPPMSENGTEPLEQTFSIRTQESYNSLSDNQRKEYKPFTGADGNTYYANSTEIPNTVYSAKTEASLPKSRAVNIPQVSGKNIGSMPIDRMQGNNSNDNPPTPNNKK